MKDRFIDSIRLTVHQQQPLKDHLLPFGVKVVRKVSEYLVQRDLATAAVKIDARQLGKAVFGGFVVAARTGRNECSVTWTGGRCRARRRLTFHKSTIVVVLLMMQVMTMYFSWCCCCWFYG